MSVPTIIMATMCVAAVAGCGTVSDAETPVPHAQPSAACTAAARGELVAVARRIYAQAAGGRNTAAARRRITRSRALASAVGADDAAATRAALAPLIKHQITRAEIDGAHGVLARYG